MKHSNKVPSKWTKKMTYHEENSAYEILPPWAWNSNNEAWISWGVMWGLMVFNNANNSSSSIRPSRFVSIRVNTSLTSDRNRASEEGRWMDGWEHRGVGQMNSKKTKRDGREKGILVMDSHHYYPPEATNHCLNAVNVISPPFPLPPALLPLLVTNCFHACKENRGKKHGIGQKSNMKMR